METQMDCRNMPYTGSTIPSRVTDDYSSRIRVNVLFRRTSEA